MTEFTCTTSDESQTHALGVALGERLRAGDVVELIGELGAGKTRLVRGIAQGAGHNPDEVSSPTYVLFNEYQSLSATTILHIDAYRMSSPDELRDSGYDRAAPGSIVLIEWADRIEGAIDDDACRIEIHHDCDEHTDSKRRFHITCQPPHFDRLAPAFNTIQTP